MEWVCYMLCVCVCACVCVCVCVYVCVCVHVCTTHGSICSPQMATSLHRVSLKCIYIHVGDYPTTSEHDGEGELRLQMREQTAINPIT